MVSCKFSKLKKILKNKNIKIIEDVFKLMVAMMFLQKN